MTREGDLALPSIPAARRFAERVAAAALPRLSAGELLAASLIHEIQHRIIRINLAPALLPVQAVARRGGAVRINRYLRMIAAEFPPEDVYSRIITPGQYLQGTHGLQHRARMLEELWLLDLAASNPALSRVKALFPEAELRSLKAFSTVLPILESVLRAGSDPAKKGLASLPDMLTAAARHAPDSLFQQLSFLKSAWGGLMPDLTERLDQALALVAEEKPPAPPPAPPAATPWRRGGKAPEGADNFSRDSGWMASLVLVAKHTHIWLRQISNRWQRPVNSLADIPDEELKRLAAQGFSGIWLVGLWERSPASLRIKRLSGDPDALASAYAINRYHVAAELGGDAALETLSRRAAAAGIRLGADMVPNHMGLDSPLVRDHPELFIQRDDRPYAGYTFNGPELSPDPTVSIRIEDHYHDRSDAAVVFRMRDREGRHRFIYHGNDGTHIPWNDTAQLDFLQKKVRDTVLDQIRNVARRVPIIRFDAAMTLTRRHFRRLWYPPPGEAGAIPSRAESALEETVFNALMPEEFWRQVVDAAAGEFSDTLLLAEAFWLMEDYFVRRLGMHRVYNSAFMHMLRNEENAAFRDYIRSIWNDNPAILSRFVNFLSTPDEETAARQFGRGDKYFAACTLLVTLPGLPMFSHGQVEGLEEKYGMEFAAPRSSEQTDEPFAHHHEAFIFPLMRQRRRFSAADDLEMYSFRTHRGDADDNVLAFSRGTGRNAMLVLVHNRYATTEGYLRDADLLPGNTLADTLRLPGSCNRDLCFRDLVSGREVIQSAADIRQRGLHFRLHAYQHHLLEYQGPVDSIKPSREADAGKLANSESMGYAEKNIEAGERVKSDGKTQRKKTEKKKPDQGRR